MPVLELGTSEVVLDRHRNEAIDDFWMKYHKVQERMRGYGGGGLGKAKTGVDALVAAELLEGIIETGLIGGNAESSFSTCSIQMLKPPLCRVFGDESLALDANELGDSAPALSADIDLPRDSNSLKSYDVVSVKLAQRQSRIEEDIGTAISA